MSRPALLDKLFQAGKTLFKPALIPVDNTTIKAVNNQLAVQKATATTIGGVKISGEDGLVMKSDGSAAVDFDAMPTDKFETMLKSIRVPIWLTGNKSFYVNGTTGADTLDAGRGESASKPFQTIRACMNYVTDNYNLSRYNVRIIIADGMYNEGILSLYQYNTTTGVIIIESEGIAHRDSVIIKGNIALENSNIYYIRNITIDQEDAYSYGYGVLASQGRIDLYNVVIDASDTVVENGTLYCIRAEGGTIRIWSSDIENQNGVIVKIPATLQGCIMANQGGLISFTADITIQNNGNFVIACAYALQSGTIERSSSSLPYPDRSALIIASDTVTGPRYNALLNGIINSRNGGAEYFPGSENGITSKGGQYN